jgi:hypothetical protein
MADERLREIRLRLPKGVDWVASTSDNLLIRTTMMRLIREKLFEDDNARPAHMVLCVTREEAEALAKSEEVHAYVTQLSPPSFSFLPCGLPDRLYGVPVEVEST